MYITIRSHSVPSWEEMRGEGEADTQELRQRWRQRWRGPREFTLLRVPYVVGNGANEQRKGIAGQNERKRKRQQQELWGCKRRWRIQRSAVSRNYQLIIYVYVAVPAYLLTPLVYGWCFVGARCMPLSFQQKPYNTPSILIYLHTKHTEWCPSYSVEEEQKGMKCITTHSYTRLRKPCAKGKRVRGMFPEGFGCTPVFVELYFLWPPMHPFYFSITALGSTLLKPRDSHYAGRALFTTVFALYRRMGKSPLDWWILTRAFGPRELENHAGVKKLYDRLEISGKPREYEFCSINQLKRKSERRGTSEIRASDNAFWFPEAMCAFGTVRQSVLLQQPLAAPITAELSENRAAEQVRTMEIWQSLNLNVLKSLLGRKRDEC